MPTVTVSGSGTMAVVNYATNDAAPYSSTLATAVSAALTDGTLTSYQYVSGPTAPGPASGTAGAVVIATTPTTPVAIPTTDSAVVISAPGATTITGQRGADLHQHHAVRDRRHLYLRRG
jgi:hypothetical protein